MNTPVVTYTLDSDPECSPEISPETSPEFSADLAIIRIDNPPVNALSQAVRAGIAAALEQASKDRSRAVLILCSGRTFIAGADITEFGKPLQPPSLPDLIGILEHFSKPVIAALHGNALGGGLELAMGAHYRCALATTRLGLPEVKLGLLPGAGGTQRLPRLIGPQAALDMITSGAPIDAPKALELGLIDQLIEGDLEAAAKVYARQLIAAGAAPRPTGARRIETQLPEDFFTDYRNRIARKTRGQIAPGFIVELVELATRSTLEEGLAQERKRFLECLGSAISSAMRHVFFAERAAAKLPDIPAKTPSRTIRSVAVIGAGTMGGGIAMCFAHAGIPVTLLETTEPLLERGLERIRNNYQTSLKRGRLTQPQIDGLLARISGSTGDAALGEADLVIEAVYENLAVKQEVFSKLDRLCKPGCILATNTSYLDINEIAAATGRPGDVIGAHFFSPANVMKLLEVVRTPATRPEVVQTFMRLARTIGKIPVAVGICHGFVGNRMLKTYARQAQLLLLEGATPQQIDGAMETWGMAMGPLAVGDLAGLDIGYRSRRDLGIESRAVKEFALADTLVEMERLGQKTALGYYRYDPATRKREPDPVVLELIEKIAGQFQVPRRKISDTEIVDRLTLSLVNEGAAILAEKIAQRPSDIDIVYIYGYAFPAWRGGPMFYADSLGLNTVAQKLEELRQLTGDECWQPAPLLRDLLSSGEAFASLN